MRREEDEIKANTPIFSVCRCRQHGMKHLCGRQNMMAAEKKLRNLLILEPAIRHGNTIHFIMDTKVPSKVPLIISRFFDKSKQTRKIHPACLTIKASCNVRRLYEG